MRLPFRATPSCLLDLNVSIVLASGHRVKSMSPKESNARLLANSIAKTVFNPESQTCNILTKDARLLP
jgi:hypothetical protein